MNGFRDKLLRVIAAGTVFWMALVLTPRAWVDHVQTRETAEVPVRALDQPDECLWCEPSALEPVNCTDEEQQEPMWLNPDELSQPDSAPCLDRESDDKPSA